MSSIRRHFIVGYGSLINSISRSQTGETGQVWPVKLTGYERHWSVMSPEFGMSSVAVLKIEDSASSHVCNGVLVEVPEDQLTLFDEREKGYQRVRVAPDSIEAYSGALLPDGTYWIYITDRVDSPSQQCPIALSYVDVILTGCFEFSDAFLEDLITYTKGWDSVVLNDRLSPRYPRVQTQLDTRILAPYLRLITPLTSEELSVTYEL
ncbi:gamma-glutamylcyclotransferase family protein [Marinomonas mediterranea]|uniref:gamma-glutamylcyclotransferase family protein n=1 Tax=Marinomonas mediterranea TaxID=119864 RepID=UPI00234B3A76|nr:gamma-glutamylcyclotransferase family protein [Marinomonas mediterranea]WCN07573.1 gamma-glutamylcyclotransferase [Marinomonas mediterranea]WCN11671.1 gamma-glutamylcyclotransferase [Marinomonas mediterranea]